jgi:uncharacterized protein YbjT (DUF2867 family)
MSSPRTALIAGASGLVGSQLLRLLLHNERYSHVIALVRKPLPMQHPKLEQRVISFDKLHLLEDIAADDVFCTLGTTMKIAGSKENFYRVDYTYVIQLAETAAKLGADKFLVVSAMGANADSVFFYNQVKGKMENTLRQMPFNAVHIFQPSLLLGERTQKRTGEKIGEFLMNVFSFALTGPFKKYRAISAEKVAQAMLQAALQNQSGVHVHLSDEIANS